jgi:hypothetical protein
VSSGIEVTGMASSNTGKLAVRLFDKDGLAVQGPFQFVTFRIHQEMP